MRIYIVGSVASGKTMLAKQLSEKTNIQYNSLDEVVHEPDKGSLWGNKKRKKADRDRLFSEIINQDSWIIEDTGRPCFEEGLKQADHIIILEPSRIIRNKRIIFRWFRQRLHIEKCIYKPRLAMLKCMLKWSHDYDLGKDRLKERLVPFNNKLISIKNRSEIKEYIRSCLQNEKSPIFTVYRMRKLRFFKISELIEKIILNNFNNNNQ